MKKRIRFQCQGLATFLSVGACAFLTIGCANDAAENASLETQPEVQATSVEKAEIVTSPVSTIDVVGIWLGTASLNEAKLQRKLDSLAPAQQQSAILRAQSFLSTTMAIEYKSNGTVENDLELVAVDGQLLRDGSVGTWSVVDSTEGQIVIETTESLSDGSVASSQVTYRFGDGQDQFVVAVPVNEDLQDCDAVLVFQRQILPVANVAENNSPLQVK